MILVTLLFVKYLFSRNELNLITNIVKLVFFKTPYKATKMSKNTRVLKYTNTPPEKRVLMKAILNYGGNASAFAKELGINKNIVYRWIDQDFIAPPAQYCRKIEQLTNGEITCEQLRPDVFGPSLIVEDTIENRFKKCIGMMNCLKADVDNLVSKKPNKRGR
jgi:DNA-binding transcriptional regulator YdaS (Cro superfamily)